MKTQVLVQLVVNKAQKIDVELSEGGHNLVVDILVVIIANFVWCDPCDAFAHDFCLQVNSFDGDEHLELIRMIMISAYRTMSDIDKGTSQSFDAP